VSDERARKRSPAVSPDFILSERAVRAVVDSRRDLERRVAEGEITAEEAAKEWAAVVDRYI
jgi:hypothetical protein